MNIFQQKRAGFSLMEILVVVAIISVFATIVGVALLPVREKGRDTKRKAEIAQMGKLFAFSCFFPSSGDGDYDLTEIWDELKTAYPQYANVLSSVPKDPLGGSESESKYRYRVDTNGKRCVLYANLERDDERVTLEHLIEPTPGGGSGIFRATSDGPNGSQIYIQASN